MLPWLEKERQGIEVDLGAQMAEMKKIQSLHQIRGFPLNLPFTDIDSVVEAVYNTDVHSNEDVSAEFALAVYCHSFVNNVCSIWVYVASLTRTSYYSVLKTPYPDSLMGSPTREPMSAATTMSRRRF